MSGAFPPALSRLENPTHLTFSYNKACYVTSSRLKIICSLAVLRQACVVQIIKMTGKIHLVGAGPGDPDLLTVKALKLLERATVVLHDDLVSPAILALANPHAEIVNVGKRAGAKGITQADINALMIDYSRRG